MRTQLSPLRHPARAAVGFAAVAGLISTGCSAGGSGSLGGTSSPSASASSSTSAGAGSSGSTSVASTNSVPFPVAVGNTWTYKDTTALTSGTSVDKIAAVTPVPGGQQVTMDSTITIAGRTTHSSGYFIFHSDGSVTYPFSQFNSSSSQVKVRLLSGNIIWPPAAQLAAGQVSHNVLKIEVTTGVSTVDLTANIAVRGEGTQSVTVPAGTYSATVVRMIESETVGGIALTSQITTWLASGIGPVKTKVTISEGSSAPRVTAENVLTSFTKG
jgi:hypothetical protein